MLSGLSTSVLNWGWWNESRIFEWSRLRTEWGNLGEIFWGLYETLNSGIPEPAFSPSPTSSPLAAASSSSGFSNPAWPQATSTDRHTE